MGRRHSSDTNREAPRPRFSLARALVRISFFLSFSLHLFSPSDLGDVTWLAIISSWVRHTLALLSSFVDHDVFHEDILSFFWSFLLRPAFCRPIPTRTRVALGRRPLLLPSSFSAVVKMQALLACAEGHVPSAFCIFAILCSYFPSSLGRLPPKAFPNLGDGVFVRTFPSSISEERGNGSRPACIL